MSYPLGQGELCTLRGASAHWHCTLFRVARRGGGPPLRLSTLDRQFVWRGEIYIPTAGERYDQEFAAALEAGDSQLLGALSPETVTPVDILRGVYDSARVDQYEVDWKREKRYRHDVWYVDEMTHNGRVWSAKLSTAARFLQRARGEVYNTTCPAILGDGRCKKVVTTYALTVSAVTDVQLEFAYTPGVGTTFGSMLFALGSIEWTSGNNRGSLSRVFSSTNVGGFQLSTPTRFPIRVGDTFKARPGCDGLATTCKNVHNNLENFQGNERQRNSKQLIVNRGIG